MIHSEPQEKFALPRWSFYSASLACLTTWLEMMCMVGKIPKFGKYVHMFRLVRICPHIQDCDDLPNQVGPGGDRQVHGRLHLPPHRLHDELHDLLCRSRGIPELSWDVHQGRGNQQNTEQLSPKGHCILHSPVNWFHYLIPFIQQWVV